MKGQVEVQESYDLVICESYDLVICEQQHRQYLALICLQEFFFLFPCHDYRLGKHRDQNNGENAEWSLYVIQYHGWTCFEPFHSEKF